MSDTTVLEQRQEITIDSISIDSEKWVFNHNDKEFLEKMIVQGGLVLVMITVFVLFSKLVPPIHNLGGTAFLIGFISALVGSFILLPKVAKRAIAKRSHKRNEYRTANAPLIIEELRKAGWTVAGSNAVQTLVVDDNPYLLNEDGVRFYARHWSVGRNGLHALAELNDPETKRALAEEEKQRSMRFHIERYEEKRGTALNSEQKAEFAAGFEAGFVVGKNSNYR